LAAGSTVGSGAAGSGGELVATPATSRRDNGAAGAGPHAQPEPVGPRTTTVVRLERALALGHGCRSPGEFIVRSQGDCGSRVAPACTSAASPSDSACAPVPAGPWAGGHTRIPAGWRETVLRVGARRHQRQNARVAAETLSRPVGMRSQRSRSQSSKSLTRHDTDGACLTWGSCGSAGGLLACLPRGAGVQGEGSRSAGRYVGSSGGTPTVRRTVMHSCG
jgi:hypothetical protein